MAVPSSDHYFWTGLLTLLIAVLLGLISLAMDTWQLAISILALLAATLVLGGLSIWAAKRP